MNRRHLLRTAAAAFTLPTLAQTASAADAGRLLFGFPSGAIGSVLGVELSRMLVTDHPGLQYKMENLTAASSTRSIELAKRAKPDGHTLVQVQSSQVSIFPQMLRDLPYDPLVDLTPIACLGSYTWAFSVGPAVPAEVRSMSDYFRWVSENPEWRTYGATLFGSQGHLAGLLLARNRGAALRPTTFAGTSPLIKDMVAGNLAAGFSILGNGEEHFKSGTLRALAVMSAERWPSKPDVPTFKELGLPSIDYNGWYGWYAPAGTAPDKVETLHRAVEGALSSSAGKDLLKRLQLQSTPMSAAQQIERVRSEQRYFASVTRDLRIGLMG